MADAVIVVCIAVAMFGIDKLSHVLVPPDGPIFLLHSRFEFPFQWMIDIAHIIAFGTFIVGVAQRMWWRLWR